MSDNISVTAGTGVTLASDDIGGVQYPRVKLGVGADGASTDFSGTFAEVTNLAGGSVKVTTGTLAGGTITALGNGTITAGTTTDLGIFHPNEFATVVSGTGTATGTIKPLVTGSAIYVTGIVISSGTASSDQIVIGDGTTTKPILGTMTFNAGGGIALTPINPPLRTTSGSALVWAQSGTSPVSITAVGFVK